MTPRLKLALAATAFLAAGVYCFYEYRRVREVATAVAAIPRPPRRAGKKAPVRPPPQPEPVAATPVAAPASNAEISARVKEIIDKSPKGPGGIPIVRPEALFAELPTLKAAYDKAAAAQQRLGYEQFLRTVKLSPQEEARFLQLLADREATWGDVRAAAPAQGLALNDPLLDKADERNMAGTEADLRALLGAERYGQLQQYRETLDARLGMFSLNTLVATSYRTGAPLTLEQMNRLATLTTESGVLNYDRAMKRTDGVPFDRVVSEARTFLTPAQAEVFELLVDQRQMSLARSQIMRDRVKKSPP